MPKKRPKPLPVNPADLKRIRTEAGLSQEKLAAQIGSARTNFPDWESGHKQPGLRIVQRWAAVCGYELQLVPKKT